MKRIFVLVAVVSVCLVGPVRADWVPGDDYKMHYPQLPDTSITGIDIDNTGIVLADDFLCIETGPITDIHIWGSFADDILPVNGVDWMSFELSIHEDLPIGDPRNPYPYSIPGALLWSTSFCGPQHGPDNGFAVQLWEAPVEEWFWDPLTGTVTTDHECYQYNFYIDPAEAFVQQENTIYWLDVKGTAVCEDATFGWKTSLDHWNDDAVYFEDLIPEEPIELRYPTWHPMASESINMAFVITPEPASLGLLGIGAWLLGRRRR